MVYPRCCAYRYTVIVKKETNNEIYTLYIASCARVLLVVDAALVSNIWNKTMIRRRCLFERNSFSLMSLVTIAIDPPPPKKKQLLFVLEGGILCYNDERFSVLEGCSNHNFLSLYAPTPTHSRTVPISRPTVHYLATTSNKLRSVLFA